MQKISNEYIDDKLIINPQSKKYPPVSILLDVELLPDIKIHRWCWEASKGLVYAYDGTHEAVFAEMLGLNSRKIYLYKWILYLLKWDTQWCARHTTNYKVLDIARRAGIIYPCTTSPTGLRTVP